MPLLRTLYFALVYPYLQYATTVWGSTYKTTLNRPLVLQKRTRRVNTKSCFDAPSAHIYTLQISLFMFFKNKLLPVSFHDMFSSSSQLHSYNTRNAMNYRSQFSRAMLGNLLLQG